MERDLLQSILVDEEKHLGMTGTQLTLIEQIGNKIIKLNKYRKLTLVLKKTGNHCITRLPVSTGEQT